MISETVDIIKKICSDSGDFGCWMMIFSQSVLRAIRHLLNWSCG